MMKSKTAKRSKRGVFSARQEKCHGKANACHDILAQYCGKRTLLERINPNVRLPLSPVFLPLAGLPSILVENQIVQIHRNIVAFPHNIPSLSNPFLTVYVSAFKKFRYFIDREKFFRYNAIAICPRSSPG